MKSLLESDGFVSGTANVCGNIYMKSNECHCDRHVQSVGPLRLTLQLELLTVINVCSCGIVVMGEVLGGDCTLYVIGSTWLTRFPLT